MAAPLAAPTRRRIAPARSSVVDKASARPPRPKPTLRQAQKDMTRQRLIDAALATFASRGYVASKIEEIATAAGTTRATFYLHFNTKADLVSELGATLAHEVSGLNGGLQATIASGSRADVTEWLTAAFAFWERRRVLAAVQAEAAAVDASNDDHRSRIIEEAVVGIVAGLADLGRFDESGRRVRAVLMYSQLQSVFQRFMGEGWEIDRRETLDVMADMWMAAITPHAPHAPPKVTRRKA